jgi:predicted dehydrogenase
MTINVLVVGAGSIGRRHITNLVNLDYDLNLTVVEPSKTNREKVSCQFNVSTNASLDSALDEKRFDVAFVCTPNHLHVKQAKKLANADCHLFIEKPLSLDSKEAKSLLPVIDNSKVFLMVGCNLRFHPGVKCLTNVLQSGKIGRPLYARAQFAHYLPNWRPGYDYRKTYSANRDQGGGVLLDDIHEPDYLCWLFGKVSKACGFLSTIGNLDLDVEDIADYVLWHGDNFYSHIHTDYLRVDKIRGCELIGTEGTVVWHSRGKNPEQISVDLYTSTSGQWESLYSDDTYNQNVQYIEEIQYFLDCIIHKRRPMNGLDEVIALMDVLDMVRESAHENYMIIEGS